MYCGKCGCEVKQGQNFCPNCGGALGEQQVHGKKTSFSKSMIFLTIAASLFILIVAAVKLMGKSDEERIVGTWILVEEMYGRGRLQTDKIGAQLVFEGDGMLYDEKDVLRAQLDAGTLISWNKVEDNNMLIFTNNWGEQFSAEYEFNGKKLKIIDSEDVYTVWERQ